MLSMAVQSPVNNISTYPLLSDQKFHPRILKVPILLNPSAHRIHSSTIHGQKLRTISRKPRQATTFAAPEAVTAESESETIEAEEPFPDQETERAEVLVKKVEKPRLVLKFIWMEKNIGLALDQVLPGHGTVPLSPYFFWPRKDAWEELKATLESKPWISQKKMIILLNQATDIINLWQQSGGSLTTQ